MSSSPGWLKPIDVTRSSCWCSPSMSRNSGSISSTRSSSKPRRPCPGWPSTASSITLAFWQRVMGAHLLSARSRLSRWHSFSSSGTRSILFSSSKSAKATCSTASFSTPSGFSSSRCSSMWKASMTVTIASRRAKLLMFSSTKNVCATGAGSARPVVSMMMWSSLGPPSLARFMSLVRMVMRSTRTVQQMQPLFISNMSSSDWNLDFTRASSMPTSPNSFSMTAMRLP
mmetsp:Transcript_17523/g.44926  ORF Transcript_17523/g.44926 Transcript_17523/m.44926 type:complete len:228 (+) Transcript_17523:917-1600(+)